MSAFFMINTAGHHYHIEIEHLNRSHYRRYISKWHIHPAYHLILISHGTNKVAFDDRTVQASCGSLLFINPLIPHSFILEPGDTVEHTCLIWRFCDEQGQYGLFPLQEISTGKDPSGKRTCESYIIRKLNKSTMANFLTRHAQAMESFNHAPKSLRTSLIINELWLWSMGLLINEEHQPETAMPLTERISNYVERNLTNPELNIGSIATELNRHPNHLNVVFRRSRGMSLNRYINHKRLELARSILDNSDYSVSQIASLCGYSQHSYFTRIFRKILGISPSQYRAESQKNSTNP